MQEQEVELLDIPTVSSPNQSTNPLSQYVVEPAKRFGEAVLGAPGTIENLATKGVQYLTGMQPAKVPGILDIGKGIATGTMPETSENFFPTPEDIRHKFTEPVFGKPSNEKNMYASWVEDVASDAGSLMAGIVPGLGGIGASKAFTLSGIGNTVKDISKLFGAGETSGDLIKSGSMIIADMLGTRKNLIKRMNSLYGTAEELSAGKNTNALPLNNFITKERKALVKLIPEDRKEIGGILDTIGGQIQGKGGASRVNVDDIWDLKKRLNAKISELINSNKPPKKVIQKLTSINDELRNTLQEFGNRNPDFKKSFNTAESIYAGLNDRSQINSFLRKHISLNTLRNPLSSILLGSSLVTGNLGTAMAGAGAGYGMRYGVEVMDLLYKSPEARRLYAQTLKAAAQENAPAMIKYADKLDKYVDKYTSKQEPKIEEGEIMLL